MIQHFADWLVNSLIGLDPASRLGAAVNFFVYDTIKILLLLFFISAIMGVVNTYFPIDRLRNFLNSKRLYGTQYLLASLFGAITPFCSCSSVPLFIGFVKGGIPLGVTLSFLITSPMVNEVAVAMFLATFGLKVTLIYLLSGVLLGSLGGFILGKFHLERYLTDWVQKIQSSQHCRQNDEEANKHHFWKVLPAIIADSWKIVKGVLLYVIVGLAVGAAMHGYVPDAFFERHLSGNGLLTVPLAVILAVPMYSNAAAIVPIIQVFVAKGVPIGTAIAFMMGVVGLSIPEATMLKKVMTWKLIAIFFGSITLLFILSGWLFNWVL